jgi:uncharacterized protein (TIGR03435 family)
MDERERACDEDVLRAGNQPYTYAEGVLKVCELYLQSPLRCMSRVTGSNLKARIQAILTGDVGCDLSFFKRTALATAGMLVLAMPIAIGLAQNTQLKFDAVSIKANKKPDTSLNGGICRGIDTKVDEGGGLGAALGLEISLSQPGLGRCNINAPVKHLIGIAYEIPLLKWNERILGGPDWIGEKYRIDAVAPNPGTVTEAELHRMMKSMLADRFKLKIHTETRALSGYALLIAKNGPKLGPATSDDPKKSGMPGRPGQIISFNMPISALAGGISSNLVQPVVDETGLTGRFNYKLDWTPGQADVNFFRNPPTPEVLRQLGIDPTGPSIFTALQEQLGLRLEARKVPTEVLVIDSVQKPSEN